MEHNIKEGSLKKWHLNQTNKGGGGGRAGFVASNDNGHAKSHHQSPSGGKELHRIEEWKEGRMMRAY